MGAIAIYLVGWEPLVATGSNHGSPVYHLTPSHQMQQGCLDTILLS